MTEPLDPEPLDLTEVAAIYCSRRAVRDYARAVGLEGEWETAGRELTAYLAGARPVDREATPERWRYRRASTGIDISAAVVIEQVVEGAAPLAVVVGVTARSYRGGAKDRRR